MKQVYLQIEIKEYIMENEDDSNDLTIISVIRRSAKNSPDSIAVFGLEQNALTYIQLLEQVEKVTVFLNRAGVGRGDRVATVLENGPDMAVCFLSVAAFATCAPLNPAYGFNDYDFYFSDLNSKAVILRAGEDSPARRVAQMHELPIFELESEPKSTAGVFQLTSSTSSAADTDGYSEPEDVALVLYTSGTTSRPKIVPLTNKNITSSAAHIRSTLGLNSLDRCLNVMPLFHIHGLIGALLSTISAGGSIVCTPGFNSAEFYSWIDTYKPTWYSAVPTMHQAVLAGADDHSEIIADNKLRFIRSSSASLPPSVMLSLEEKFMCPVIESYGMTEASHQMTSNPLPPKTRKAGSVGVQAGLDVAIMDPDGVLLGSGEQGEIVIQGSNVTKGYENNPDANLSAFTNNWFRTGDLGYLDEDGYLFISGRIKEMINRGGEKIAPREVDEIFLKHTQVKQAVSFAVKHPTLGEDLATAVILSNDAKVTDQELRDYAFERLPNFKVPSRVVIVDKIPKGSTGKLQRLKLSYKLSSKMAVDYIAPRNETEIQIAKVWEKILAFDKIGVYDNFFNIGGDSLSGIQAVVEIQDYFNIKLSTDTIFRYPTIAALADYIKEKLGDNRSDEAINE